MSVSWFSVFFSVLFLRLIVAPEGPRTYPEIGGRGVPCSKLVTRKMCFNENVFREGAVPAAAFVDRETRLRLTWGHMHKVQSWPGISLLCGSVRFAGG